MFEEQQTPEETSPETCLPDRQGGLSFKQERFCLEYLKDLIAAAAARRAGYSEPSSRHTGSRILAMPQAKAFIEVEREKLNTRLRLAADVASNELLEMAFLDRSMFLDPEGDIVNPLTLPEHLRSAIQVNTKNIKRDGKVTTVTTYSLCNNVQMMQKISAHAQRQKPTEDATVTHQANYALMEDGSVEEI